MSGYGRLSAAALTILPGPHSTITFVRQKRGPYAGHWILPGGRIEFGESVPDAARREAFEETGALVGSLTMTGVYEVRGRWRHGGYHFIIFAFLAVVTYAPAGPASTDGGVSDVIQDDPHRISPHPTVMRVLNDAGLASFDHELVDRLLDQGGVTIAGLSPGAALHAGD